MLLRSAERTEGLLLRDPPPFVLQTALGDFYVEDQFNEHGVQIMSPHFMHQPERPVVVPKHRWFEPPAEREAKG